MTDRRALEDALRASAAVPAPTVESAFADALEQRLLTMDTNNVVPFARRARRVSAATTIAITLTFVGAAAAAGIVATTRDEVRQPPRPATTIPTETSTAPIPSISSSTTVPATTVPAATVPATTVPATTVSVTSAPATTPVTSTVASTSTAPTTAASATVAPTNVSVSAAPLPTTAATAVAPSPTIATTTTEVRVPATLNITCTTDGTAVTCEWSAGPNGTVRYAVLRSQPGSGLPGRAFFVDAPTTRWVDPMAVAGTAYTYLIHAMDGTQTSLGHSDAVAVTCC